MPKPDKKEPLRLAFYRTEAGNEPAREWLRGLKDTDAEACKQIGADMFAVQRAWPVGKPLVDGVGDGLFEIRSTSNKKEYRTIFGFQGSTMVVLDVFRKPPNNYKAARDRWRKLNEK